VLLGLPRETPKNNSEVLCTCVSKHINSQFAEQASHPSRLTYFLFSCKGVF